MYILGLELKFYSVERLAVIQILMAVQKIKKSYVRAIKVTN